ncbi:MAG: glutathione ABC transporter permease [Dehalococcoidia bacterium]|nr:MAG: glutathione ABC transporter permease [Dehalococcoidia bacterium]
MVKKLGLDKPLPFSVPLVWMGDISRCFSGDIFVGKKKPGAPKVFGKKNTGDFENWDWQDGPLLPLWGPLGIFFGREKRGSMWDYLGRFFCSSRPGSTAVLGRNYGRVVCSRNLGWFPSGTRGEDWSIRHLVLPCVVLAWGSAAAYLRLTRSAMLEIMDSEYLKLARAKGVSTTSLIWKHAFKNALITPLTFSALLMAGLISGVVVIENVFAWPGLGAAAVRAIGNNDFPVMSMVVILFTLIFVGLNFLADLLYVIIDPRIRYS